MRKNLKSSIYLLFPIFFLLVFAGCKQEEKKTTTHSHEEEEYTCPMHPQIVQDEPGSCPICGMDLVKKGNHSSAEVSEELNYVLKPTNTSTVSSIATVQLEEKSRQIKTISNGIVTYDTRQAFSIPIRFSGRIEKLFVTYNFQPVEKGQKILEIYSPDIVTAQRELLYLQESDPGNTSLMESAKEKLRLLGVTDKQIQQLNKTGRENYSLSIYSPYSGYMIEESALGNSANLSQPAMSTSTSSGGGMGGDGMGLGSTASTSISGPANQTEIQLREGMYLNAGQTAFRVINTDKVWAEFNIYQQDASNIKVNQPIEISFNDPGIDKIEAKVNFVQPFFEAGENFTKVRVYLSNPKGKYKVGQLATGTIVSESKNGKWIPSSAVLDLGTKTIAFVKKGNEFQPVAITTGQRSEDLIEVREGLSVGDKIAYNAQFMIDSESFIRINQ